MFTLNFVESFCCLFYDKALMHCILQLLSYYVQSPLWGRRYFGLIFQALMAWHCVGLVMKSIFYTEVVHVQNYIKDDPVYSCGEFRFKFVWHLLCYPRVPIFLKWFLCYMKHVTITCKDSIFKSFISYTFLMFTSRGVESTHHSFMSWNVFDRVENCCH